jgi:ATP-binding cassette subfamily C protein CydD
MNDRPVPEPGPAETLEAVVPTTRAWLREAARPSRPKLYALVGIGLADAACATAAALCLALALGTRLGDGGSATLPVMSFALLAIGRAGLLLLAERKSFDAGASARRRLRSEAAARILRAGPALLRQRHSAELAGVLVDRIEAMDGMFARWMPGAALAMAVPALVALAALAADPWAALLMAGCGLMVPVAMALAGLGAAAASRRQFEQLARLQTRFVDRLRGIATIVLANATERETAALAEAADALRVGTMRVLRVAFLSSAALDCAAAATLAGLAVRYGSQAQAGTLGNPDHAVFALLLVPVFFAPLRSFAAAYQDRMQAQGAAAALAGLPPLPADGPVLPVRNVAAHGATLAFEDVSLTWDPARGPALNGVSFRIPAGETMILAGPSGSGKSSIIEILLGFVAPDRGKVTVNGADLATLVPQARSRLFAWIGQRPTLFHATIADNIRFARPDASDGELADAVRFARLDGVAAALPQGLETLIGEGGHGLSGGQAQRVAIARAFLKNAPILLLDEPTSHLDPTTEAEVLDSLRRLAIGRTVLLASHSAAAHAFPGRRLDLRAGRAVAARGAA